MGKRKVPGPSEPITGVVTQASTSLKKTRRGVEIEDPFAEKLPLPDIPDHVEVPAVVDVVLLDDDDVKRRLLSILEHGHSTDLHQVIRELTKEELNSLLQDNQENLLLHLLRSQQPEAEKTIVLAQKLVEAVPRSAWTVDALIPVAHTDFGEGQLMDLLLALASDQESLLKKWVARACMFGSIKLARACLAKLTHIQKAALALPRGRSFAADPQDQPSQGSSSTAVKKRGAKAVAEKTTAKASADKNNDDDNEDEDGKTPSVVKIATVSDNPLLELHWQALTAKKASDLSPKWLDDAHINVGALGDYITPLHLACLNIDAAPAILDILVKNQGDLTAETIAEDLLPLHVAAACPPSNPSNTARATIKKQEGAALSPSDLPADASIALVYLLCRADEEDMPAARMWNSITKKNKLTPVDVAIKARRPANLQALLTWIKRWNHLHTAGARPTVATAMFRDAAFEIDLAVRESDAATLAVLLRDQEALEMVRARGHLLLEQAFVYGNYAAAVQLIAAGAAIKKPDNLLKLAIDAGSLPLVHLLVESYNADVDAIAVPETGASMLHRAIDQGFTAGVLYLLEHGANEFARTVNSVNVLMEAARASRTSCLKLLLKRKIDVNTTEKDLKQQAGGAAVEAVISGPPFAKMVFVMSGFFQFEQREIADFIRDCGGVVVDALTGKVTHCILGRDGFTEYGQPAGRGSKKYKDCRAKKIPIVTEAYIFEAIQKYQGPGYMGGVIDRALGKMGDENAEFAAEESASVLLDMMSHGTAHQAAPQTLACLLESGASISQTGHRKQTVLHVFVNRADEKEHTLIMLQRLIQEMDDWQKAEPGRPSLLNAVDSSGCTALVLACVLKKFSFAKLLLDAPQAIAQSIVPHKKKQVVVEKDEGAMDEDEEAVNEDEEARDEEARDENEEARDENEEAIDEDEDAMDEDEVHGDSMDVDLKQDDNESFDDSVQLNFRGQSLLQIFVSHGQVQLAARAIELGADVNFVSQEDLKTMPVLIVAAPACLDLLLAQPNLHLHCVNDAGETLLHKYAKSAGELTKILRATGGNFRNGLELKTKKNQETALHIAASVTACARLLVHAGANIEAENADGETPLHCAVLVHNFFAVHFLVDKGANINVKRKDRDGPEKSVYEDLLYYKDHYDITLHPNFDPFFALSATSNAQVAYPLIDMTKEFAQRTHLDWAKSIVPVINTVPNDVAIAICLSVNAEVLQAFYQATNKHLHFHAVSTYRGDCTLLNQVFTALFEAAGARVLTTDRGQDGETIVHAAVSSYLQGEKSTFFLILLHILSDNEVGRGISKIVNSPDARGTTPLTLVLNHLVQLGTDPDADIPEHHFAIVAWLVFLGADASLQPTIELAESISASNVDTVLQILKGQNLDYYLTSAFDQGDALQRIKNQVRPLASNFTTFRPAATEATPEIAPVVVAPVVKTKKVPIVVRTVADPTRAQLLRWVADLVLRAPAKPESTLAPEVDRGCSSREQFQVVFDTQRGRFHHYFLLQEKDGLYAGNHYILQLLERKPPPDNVPRRPMPKYRVFSAWGPLHAYNSKHKFLDHVTIETALEDLNEQMTDKTGYDIDNVISGERIGNKYVFVHAFKDIAKPPPKQEKLSPGSVEWLADQLFALNFNGSPWTTTFERLRLPSGFPTAQQLEDCIEALNEIENNPEQKANFAHRVLDILPMSTFEQPYHSASQGDTAWFINAILSIRQSAYRVAVNAANLTNAPLGDEAAWTEAIKTVLQSPLSCQPPTVNLPALIGCDLELMEASSSIYSIVPAKDPRFNYTHESLTVIYRVQRHAEASWSASTLKSSKLLFHHTDAAGAAVALVEGLKPPQQNDPFWPLSPFGRHGVVFTENTHNELLDLIHRTVRLYPKRLGNKVILVCAVNLDQSDDKWIRNWHQHSPDRLTDIPTKYDSVICPGKVVSSTENAVFKDTDGVAFPKPLDRELALNAPIKLDVNYPFSTLNNNHYVVFNPDKIQLRYIIIQNF